MLSFTFPPPSSLPPSSFVIRHSSFVLHPLPSSFVIRHSSFCCPALLSPLRFHFPPAKILPDAQPRSFPPRTRGIFRRNRDRGGPGGPRPTGRRGQLRGGVLLPGLRRTAGGISGAAARLRTHSPAGGLFRRGPHRHRQGGRGPPRIFTAPAEPAADQAARGGVLAGRSGPGDRSGLLAGARGQGGGSRQRVGGLHPPEPVALRHRTLAGGVEPRLSRHPGPGRARQRRRGKHRGVPRRPRHRGRGHRAGLQRRRVAADARQPGLPPHRRAADDHGRQTAEPAAEPRFQAGLQRAQRGVQRPDEERERPGAQQPLRGDWP